MKKLTILAIWLSIFSIDAFAQEAYMNISHQGIQPLSTITVEPGQEITFEYGGGGPHPMTSGWGNGTPSPVFFPTITVTSSNPVETFILDVLGTYQFHCATNPGNSNNWGTIIVEEPEIEILYGDVNFDGVINVLDIVNVINDILGVNQLSEESFVPADVNMDGIINVLDILNIVNIIVSS